MANPALPTDFASLKNQIEDHLNRADVDDEGVSALLIGLFEAQANDEVKHHQRRKRCTASLSSQYLALPDDWEYPISLAITSTSPTHNIAWVTPETMVELRARGTESAARPVYVSTADNALDFYPTPSDTYTVQMHYWATIPALSVSNTTNWLLDRHPLLYLYGSLLQGEMYFRDDDRVALWGAYVDRTFANMARTYNRSYGPARTHLKAIG